MLLLAALVTARPATAQSAAPTPVTALESTGVLLQEQTARVRVQLVPGLRYRITAACAADCTALDLAVRNYSDYEVAVDRRGTAAPALELDARAPGEYVVRVRMLACAIQPCGYRVRVQRSAVTQGERRVGADVPADRQPRPPSSP